jgi:hypothetical protein
MLRGTSSAFVFERIEWLDFAVFKNEKRMFGAALANLHSRLRLLKGWLPNGNAKRATCFSSELLVITCMVEIKKLGRREGLESEIRERWKGSVINLGDHHSEHPGSIYRIKM